MILHQRFCVVNGQQGDASLPTQIRFPSVIVLNASQCFVATPGFNGVEVLLTLVLDPKTQISNVNVELKTMKPLWPMVAKDFMP